MFSRIQLLADPQTIAERFDVIADTGTFLPSNEITGFDHALHPVITNNNSGLLCGNYRWGLVPPDWKKRPADIWNHTISAKLEYIGRRYAWQKVSLNRCLVPVTGYFEYHWNDPKGKSKTKYIMTDAAETLFALAGLFSVWIDLEGKPLHTFAICTTEANETMTFVHNKDVKRNYHRMPVMLNKADEKDWLDPSIPYMDFSFPNYKPNLIATVADVGTATQPTLFG